LFFALIAEVGPVRATVITYVNPAVAGILGVVVLRETLTLGMGLGFVLVLAGSALATRRAKRAAETARRTPEPQPGEAL
jgi:drug/metabolite transporter (DMT)-like permease